TQPRDERDAVAERNFYVLMQAQSKCAEHVGFVAITDVVRQCGKIVEIQAGVTPAPADVPSHSPMPTGLVCRAVQVPLAAHRQIERPALEIPSRDVEVLQYWSAGIHQEWNYVDDVGLAAVIERVAKPGVERPRARRFRIE